MIVLFSGTLLQYMWVAVACSSVATRGCVHAGMADNAAVADSAAVADTAYPYTPLPTAPNTPKAPAKLGIAATDTAGRM